MLKDELNRLVIKLASAKTGKLTPLKTNVSVKGEGELLLWSALIKKNVLSTPTTDKGIGSPILVARASVAKAAMVANMTAMIKRFIVNLR
jgi:hypothetical protein